MPVYEYKCEACSREFEYQQRMSDPEKETCEACGGKLERLISRTAFSLKGGGWYKDLYASSKPDKPAASADKPAASGDAGGAAAAPAAAATPAPAPSAPAASTGSSGSGSGGGGGSGTSSGGAA